MTSVSVVLCTYNGARYLLPQLESIRRQTCQPDQLIIFDDASTDETSRIATRFAESAGFTVDLYRALETRGIAANFSAAIGKATGELIFLSDQDDVWQSRKVERMIEIFRSYEHVCLVFSNANLIDGADRRLALDHWRAMGITSRSVRRLASAEAVSLLLKRGLVTGATMAFRSSLRNILLPIPQGWPHDTWISLVAAAVGQVHPLDEYLMQYRIHREQNVGLRHRSLRNSVVAAGRQLATPLSHFESCGEVGRAHLDLLERLSTAPESLAGGTLEGVREKAVHYLFRESLSRGQITVRYRQILSEFAAGQYHRYGRGLFGAIKDMMMVASELIPAW